MSIPLLDLLPHPPPRHALGRFPSPVERHPALARALGAAELSIKRDDLNGTPFGGNKLRALEWLLPGCRHTIFTMGGYGSTWCAALAATATPLGRRVHVALFPQPWTGPVAGALGRTLTLAQVHLAASRPGLPLALLKAWRGAAALGRPTWLPAGGATAHAVLGAANGALEFVRQVERGEAGRPDAVIVPLGSGGTAAGLLLGFRLAAWNVTVCAVRVTDPWFATAARVERLAAAGLALVQRHGGLAPARPGSVRLVIVTDQLGPGYGHATAAARTAAERLADAGVVADLTYAAKAAAALPAMARSFPRLCLWHTFDPRLTLSTAIEHPLLHQARAHAERLWPPPKST
jgi:D-cysteine desulfhydrase